MTDQQTEDTSDTFINLTPPEQERTIASTEVARVPKDTINYIIIAALFMGLGALLGMNLNNGGDSVNSVELRAIVQEVVQENTAEQFEQLQTIIASASTGGAIDPEALSALVQSAVEEATTKQIDFLEDDDPYLGPEDAPVVIVEFSDFLCPYCGRHYEQTLEPLMEDYDGLVRYVYRDFPGVGGQNAISSAMAAECANDQGKFWEYHGILFENQQSLGTNDMSALNDVLISYAGDLELDMPAFTECLVNRVHISDVIQDSSDAQTNGARGTPAFFINGTFVSGAQPYEVFSGIIDDKLREQGIEPPQVSLDTSNG